MEVLPSEVEREDPHEKRAAGVDGGPGCTAHGVGDSHSEGIDHSDGHDAHQGGQKQPLWATIIKRINTHTVINKYSKSNLLVVNNKYKYSNK